MNKIMIITFLYLVTIISSMDASLKLRTICDGYFQSLICFKSFTPQEIDPLAPNCTLVVDHNQLYLVYKNETSLIMKSSDSKGNIFSGYCSYISDQREPFTLSLQDERKIIKKVNIIGVDRKANERMQLYQLFVCLSFSIANLIRETILQDHDQPRCKLLDVHIRDLFRNNPYVTITYQAERSIYKNTVSFSLPNEKIEQMKRADNFILELGKTRLLITENLLLKNLSTNHSDDDLIFIVKN